MLILGIMLAGASPAQESMSAVAVFEEPPLPPPLDLPLMASNAVPSSGNFYFAFEAQASESGYPPLPYNPMAEFGFSVYWLGTNTYLVDNRTYSLAQFSEAQIAAKMLTAAALGMSLDEMEPEGGGMMLMSYSISSLSAFTTPFTKYVH